jgi:hypothetical protein
MAPDHNQDESGISGNTTRQETVLNFTKASILQNPKSDIDSIEGDYGDFIEKMDSSIMKDDALVK